MTRTALIAILCAAATAQAAPTTKAVDIKAEDGTTLKATYASPGKPGPGVILLHMCNSKRQAWDGLIPMLTAKGIHVLAVDYRGYGESGGTPQDKWSAEERARIDRDVWPKDFDKALAFLEAQPGVDKARIGAGGGSCGVNNAVQLARRHAEVTTLALLAGGATDEGQSFLESAPWIPILAVASHDDGNAVETTGWLMRFSSNPANTLKEYPNGGHGTALFAVHKDLEPALAAWFETNLVTKPVKPGKATSKPGPSGKLAAKIRTPAGVTAALAEVRAAKKTGAKVELPPEGAINVMAYGLVLGGNTKQGIELFTLNAEAHPTSANCEDSLADAYVAAKQPEQAVIHAKKTLELLPNDKSINDDLRKLIRESAEAKIKSGGKP